jgi:hypothetical protein
VPAILLFFCFLCVSTAHAVTIDFEEADLDLGISTEFGDIGPVTSKGFQIEFDCPTGTDPACGSFLTGGTDPTQLSWGPSGPIVLSAINQNNFDLFSVDLGTWGPGYELTIVGHLAAGGEVQYDLISLGDYQVTNVVLDASWQNLSSVEFISVDNPGIIDNINVSQVPVPAAAWLFGSALAGLGWFRRKA